MFLANIFIFGQLEIWYVSNKHFWSTLSKLLTQTSQNGQFPLLPASAWGSFCVFILESWIDESTRDWIDHLIKRSAFLPLNARTIWNQRSHLQRYYGPKHCTATKKEGKKNKETSLGQLDQFMWPSKAEISGFRFLGQLVSYFIKNMQAAASSKRFATFYTEQKN